MEEGYRFEIARCCGKANGAFLTPAERARAMLGTGDEVGRVPDQTAIFEIFMNNIVPLAVEIRKPNGDEKEVAKCRRGVEAGISWVRRKITEAQPDMKPVFENALNEINAACLIAGDKKPMTRDQALQQLQQGRS